MKSTLGTLNLKDFFKGLILFVGTPVLTLIQQLIPSWTPFLTEHLGKSGGIIAQAALGAFITYILKNLATDDTKEAVQTLSTQNVVMTETTTQKTVTPENVKEIQDITKPIKPPSNP